MKRALIILSLLLIASISRADVIQVNSESDLLNVLATPYLYEDFGSYTYGSYRTSPLTITENGYTVVLSSPRRLWSLDSGMSINCDSDPFILDFTSSQTPVTAFGGYVWPTDLAGNDLTGYMKVTLFDGTSHEYEFENAGRSTFLGLASLGAPFQQISIVSSGNLPNVQAWPSLDTLYVGSDPAPAVPEPSGFLLLGSGLVGLAIWIHRT